MIYLQLYKLKQFAQLPQISSLKFTIVHTIDEGHNTAKFNYHTKPAWFLKK